MTDEFSKTLSLAIFRMMRPLVRILLRNGVAFGTIAEVVRRAYVDVAVSDFAPKGKKQTVSRVSALTGLTRKEVSRLMTAGEADVIMDQARFNRAIRVISGWRNDSRYHDNAGRPAVLPLDGKGKSFAALVKQYSGDIPTMAILSMLKEAGSVSVSDQKVTLVRGAYVPAGDAEEKIEILGLDVSELISTIDHNLVSGADDLRFQRKVAYDNIAPEAVARLRKMSFKKAQALLEQLDSQFSAYELEAGSEQPGKYVSLGIYYYEKDSENATQTLAFRQAGRS